MKRILSEIIPMPFHTDYGQDGKWWDVHWVQWRGHCFRQRRTLVDWF